MSYSLRRSLGDASDINVGRRAFIDPVLSSASLEAAKIMEDMVRVPRGSRRGEMISRAERLGAGLGYDVATKFDEMRSRGIAVDKAIFDALRLSIANRRMSESLSRVKAAISASQQSGTSGLGQLNIPGINLSPNDRRAACTAAGATTMVGGVAQVVPVYGTIVGGILQLGSQIAGQALDCGKEEREAAATLAASQAREAQARAEAAAAQAAAQAAIEARQRSSTKKKVLIAVGALGIAGVAYWALT